MTRKHEKRLERLEEAVTGNDPTADLTVEHREADPAKRPDGLAYDPDEGVLAYDFWGAQQTCLDDLASGDFDIVALLGGYRSGKSVTGARWVITEALRNPGTRFLSMGVNYSQATSTTYRVLFEQLPGDRTQIVTSSFTGPEQSPIVADYNRSEHRLVLQNDSVIVLGSADKWNRYAGDEYGGIWLDEPSHYGDELHDLLEMMGTRLTAPAGPKAMCWTLTGSGYGPAWKVLEKQEDANGDPIGSRITVEYASVLDNPYIADEDKGRFRRQFEGGSREEQALHGGFAAAQGLVYDFSREKYVLPAAEARDRVEAGWRIYGYDAGWNDPRVLLEIGRTPYDQLVALDEFYQQESHVEDAVAWLQRTNKPRGRIYCEHEPSEIRKFERAGWDARQAEKSLDAGIAEVRQRLSQEDSKGDDSDDGQPGLLVSESCENLIREFLGYKEEHVGTSSAEDHALDALRYAIVSDATQGPRTIPSSF
jgi:hypothetical protein